LFFGVFASMNDETLLDDMQSLSYDLSETSSSLSCGETDYFFCFCDTPTRDSASSEL